MSNAANDTARGRLLSLVMLLFVTGGYAGMLLSAQLCEWDVFRISGSSGHTSWTATFGWPLNHCITRTTQGVFPPRRIIEMDSEWYFPYLAVNVVVILLITASVAITTWDFVRHVVSRRTFSLASLLIVTASVAGVFALDEAIYILTTMQSERIPWVLLGVSWHFRIAVWIGLFCVAHVAIVTACDLAKLAGTTLYTIARRATTSTISAPHGEL